MKGPGTWMTAACVVGALCLTTAVSSQEPAASAKGQAVVGFEQITATVTKIDHKTRAVTLTTADGEDYSFVAGEGVRNLGEVKQGDTVTATYTITLAYEVKKDGGSAAAKPAGAVAGQTKSTVTITAIDSKAPSVTFKESTGHTRTIKVQDPRKLQGVKVGDTVDLTYTEALTIKVEKPSK